ncbi:PepSY-associated TM helix domain-containing protein [Oleiagrimonas soli]|uniref:Putative iron-regulated membrane protein n=1 Tax=Oleiagrimonas soli TaxID=1543381 RepID=A0A841KTX2_9GAMM|nr:PepSY-associated TM helix domain-containing protein [Oleiagrimonas soli]MBB6185394.1 putative iron-regulated membrane protein [Oleiagrimonas soli]
MRHWLRRLHLWFGLSVGLVFALIALSGTALVYEHPLQAWLYPQLQAHDAHVPDRAQQAQILDRLTADDAKRDQLRAIGLPSPDAPYWQLMTTDGTRIYLDAQGDKVILTRQRGRDVLGLLHRFHANLLAGSTGNLLVRILGFCALFLLFSGIVLWWPRKGHLRQSLRPYTQPPTRRWVSWHRSVGVLTLPLLLVLTVTGTWLTFRGERPRPPQRAPAAKRVPAQTTATVAIDWSSVLQRAHAAAPDATLSMVSLPARGRSIVDVRASQPGKGRLTLQVDTASTQPARLQVNPRQRGTRSVMSVVHGLHAGRLGGTWWEVLTAFAGLLPPFFVVTGFLFWWTRRKYRTAPRTAD